MKGGIKMDYYTGKIEGKEITSGQAANGNAWTRCVFTINQKKYSTFDSKIIKKFDVGNFVKIGGEQGEKYWDMKTMVDEEPNTKSQENAQPQAPNEATDLLRQILAELKALTELAKNQNGN